MYSGNPSTSDSANSSENRPALRRLRAILANEGSVQLGVWLLQGNSLIAEGIASCTVSWVALDGQHGLFDQSSLASCINIFRNTHIACLVRVSSNDAHAIGWALDAGADGVIVPMVESAGDARKALEAARFPPLGSRSVGPFAAAARGARFSTAGDPPLCLVMIESAKGVKAAREIASVEGLDGIFVGPGDLAVSLGLAPTLDADDAQSKRATGAIAAAAQERGLILGVFSGHGSDATRWTREGFTLIASTTDIASLRSGIASELEATVSRSTRNNSSRKPETDKGNKKMIDLYYYMTPNGHEASIMLEETGLPYNLKPVDLLAGEQFQHGYLAINPNNKIPAIVDQEGPQGNPHTVFESSAILIYLAEKAGKLLPAEPAARSRALQWLIFQASNVGPNFAQLVHFQALAEKKVPEAIQRFGAEVTRLYGVLERRLAEHPFLAGDEYSVADIAMFPWMTDMVRELQAFDWAPYPHVQRWHATIAARDAVRRGLAVTIGQPGKS
nr:aldolase/citrate lyase family protein [Sphingomonas sp. Y57]